MCADLAHAARIVNAEITMVRRVVHVYLNLLAIHQPAVLNVL